MSNNTAIECTKTETEWTVRRDQDSDKVVWSEIAFYHATHGHSSIAGCTMAVTVLSTVMETKTWTKLQSSRCADIGIVVDLVDFAVERTKFIML